MSIVDGTTEWTACQLHLMLFSDEELFVRNLDQQAVPVLEKLLELLANRHLDHDSRVTALRKNAITHVRALIAREMSERAAETKTKPPVKWELECRRHQDKKMIELLLKAEWEPFSVTVDGSGPMVWFRKQVEVTRS